MPPRKYFMGIQRDFGALSELFSKIFPQEEFLVESQEIFLEELLEELVEKILEKFLDKLVKELLQ